MVKEESARFEIPADMQALAEKSVEQAQQAFEIFVSAAQHAIGTAEHQAASAQAGAMEVGELAMAFAERYRLLVRIRSEIAAGQGSQGRDGASR